jgi:hypothetical protein
MSLRAKRSNLPLLEGDCHVALRAPRNDNSPIVPMLPRQNAEGITLSSNE